jgi:hypothetical protein
MAKTLFAGTGACYTAAQIGWIVFASSSSPKEDPHRNGAKTCEGKNCLQ